MRLADIKIIERLTFVPASFLFSIGSEEMEHLACLLLLQLRLQALFLSQLWQACFLLKLLLLFPPEFL